MIAHYKVYPESTQGTAIKESISPYDEVTEDKQKIILFNTKERVHLDTQDKSIYVVITDTAGADDVTSYRIKKDINQVEIFLDDHPELNELLPEIETAISSHFGNFQKIRYDVFQDPESNDKQLLIEIISIYSPQESLDRLRNFDRNWWIQYSEDLNNLVVINVGF